MEKLTAFAEKYLEWVVLAVAGVFVLFMVYLYVLNNPTTAELAGDKVGPGEVDEKLLEGNATRLQSAINNPRTVDIEVENVVEAIAAKFDKQDDTFPQIARETVPSLGADFELPDLPEGGEMPEESGGVFIAELPKIPPATVALVYDGKAKAIPFALEGIDDVAPEGNPDDAIDTNWVKVVYEIPLAQLRQSWQQAALPNVAKQTVFLDAHLVREELLPNGEWGPAIKIDRLPTVFIPEEPAVGNKGQEESFRNFMAQQQVDIVMEPFFQFEEGDDPRFEPVQEEEGDEGNVAGRDDDFNPEDFLEGPIPDDLTPEQREAVLDARRKEAQRRQREGNRPRGGGPGGFGGFEGYGGEFGPDSGAFLPIAQSRPPSGREFENFGEFGGYGGEFGFGGFGYGDEFGDPRGGRPGIRRGDQEIGYAPRSFFNPLDDSDLDANVRGWLYDITAEPGKTYRYKVMYALQNPLWNYDAGDEFPEDKLALLDPLFIESDQLATGWSEQIEVEPDTYLFLAKEIRGNDNSPEFTVFRWKDGTMNEESFTASPGDPIGGMKDDIDYTTGWILADVRQDPATNERVAVLIHTDGRVQIRGKADLSDDQVDELRDQIQIADSR